MQKWCLYAKLTVESQESKLQKEREGDKDSQCFR